MKNSLKLKKFIEKMTHPLFSPLDAKKMCQSTVKTIKNDNCDTLCQQNDSLLSQF